MLLVCLFHVLFRFHCCLRLLLLACGVILAVALSCLCRRFLFNCRWWSQLPTRCCTDAVIQH